MRRTFTWVPWLSLLALAGGLGLGCKKSVPPAPAGEAKDEPAKLEVNKDDKVLFTYVEPKGTFATTDKAEDVPENARRLVRVVDPAKVTGNKQDATRVYAVDLGELAVVGGRRHCPVRGAGFAAAPVLEGRAHAGPVARSREGARPQRVATPATPAR